MEQTSVHAEFNEMSHLKAMAVCIENIDSIFD